MFEGSRRELWCLHPFRPAWAFGSMGWLCGARDSAVNPGTRRQASCDIIPQTDLPSTMRPGGIAGQQQPAVLGNAVIVVGAGATVAA